MKKLTAPVLITVLFILSHKDITAQPDKESEIRELEMMGPEAWVNKDSTTLFKLFSPELVVNAPNNRVVSLDMLKMRIRAGKVNYSYVEKKIQKISFIHGMAVVMGNDIVKPQGAMENAGKTVTRQYTNIWIRDGVAWRLTIRQATIISIF